MPRPANTPERFWGNVSIRGDNDCWPWMKCTNRGYGRLDMPGTKRVYAHRVAYSLANPGSIPLNEKAGINVCHKCDNPICCNPAHLYLGDHAQNMRDKKERGRCPDFRGIKGPNAKLSTDDVRDIRMFKLAGATKNAIALLFNVSISCIKNVISRRTYYDVS